MSGRVDGQVAVLDRSAVDHAERHQDVADGRRVEALAEQFVGEALDVAALDIAEALRTELGQDAIAEGSLVAADRARLVEVARPCPHLSRAHPGEEIVAGLGQRYGRRRAKLAAVDRRLRLGPPGSSGGERRERLAQPLLVAGAPRARLVGRAAVAPAPLARRARLPVSNLDPRELTHDPSRVPPRDSPRDSARQSRADMSGSGRTTRFLMISKKYL